MKLLAIALLACSHPMVPVTAGDGHMYAVVRLVAVRDDQSNMGGLHYTFEIDEPGDRHRLVHGGRHGQLLMPDGTLPEVTMGRAPVRPNDYYVADLILFAKPIAGHEVGGQLAHGLPDYNGDAYRYAHAHDVRDARCRLAHLATLGMEPYPSANIDAHPTRHETVAIARVTGGGTSVGYPIASVSGAVPEPAIEAPIRETLPIGQLVVIASAAGKITRWFVVPDLATARAWLTEIAKSGWPTAPFSDAY
jgi:hypothetical protein